MMTPIFIQIRFWIVNGRKSRIKAAQHGEKLSYDESDCSYTALTPHHYIREFYIVSNSGTTNIAPLHRKKSIHTTYMISFSFIPFALFMFIRLFKM